MTGQTGIVGGIFVHGLTTGLHTHEVLKEKTDTGGSEVAAGTVGGSKVTGETIDITRVAPIVRGRLVLTIWTVQSANGSAINKVVNGSIVGLTLRAAGQS